jgi:hypothetical protein
VITRGLSVTSLTVGSHPMAYRREEMPKLGVTPAVNLARFRSGQRARVS